MSRRVLVTGSSGFVGTQLCAHLASRGYEVLGCDQAAPKDDPARRVCDIASADGFAETLRWALPIDCIVHLAAITFVPEAAKNPALVREVNLNGTIHVIDSLREHAPGARLLFVSTSEIYGPPQKLPVDEYHPIAPQNAYAKSKAEADEYCRSSFVNEGLDIVRMRPFNHSGPGQSEAFVLPSFARQVARMKSGAQEPVIRVGNLESARDFMHVDDVVRAYELALEKGVAGEAYNLCSGRSQRVCDALDALIALSGLDVRIEVDLKRLRPGVPEIRGSHEKFTACSGWKPAIAFQTLLEDLLAYWFEIESAASRSN